MRNNVTSKLRCGRAALNQQGTMESRQTGPGRELGSDDVKSKGQVVIYDLAFAKIDTSSGHVAGTCQLARIVSNETQQKNSSYQDCVAVPGALRHMIFGMIPQDTGQQERVRSTRQRITEGRDGRSTL